MHQNRMLSFAQLLLVFVLVCGCGRNETDVVAVVNGEPVTADQFRDRYTKYLTSTGMKDNILVRKQVLDNMINERLIFADLVTKGAVHDSAFQKGMELIRRQALADGYSRRITTDTMTVTEQQLEKEFQRYNTRMSARYVYAKTRAEAEKLRKRLVQGETYERLARETFQDPGLANNGGSLGSFGWGEMEEALEEAAYTLPVGKPSAPIKLSMGYAIVRVDSRVSANPLASEADFAKVKQKLGDAMVKRTAPHVLRTHIDEITRGLDPQFDERTLKAIVAEWGSFTGDSVTTLHPESPTVPPADLRGRNVVRLQGAWWTVETLKRELAETKGRQRRRVKNVDALKEVILGLASRREVLRRAEAMHIESDPRVADQIANLSDDFRLRYWAGTVEDTVGRGVLPDTLLFRLYQEHTVDFQDPPMVNVAEVLIRTEEEAKHIANEARQGVDFARLARTKSVRLWAAKRGGELGFNSKAGYGVMGEKFFSAHVGEVVGPDKVDPYWGVFKILERKEGRLKSFEESKEQVRTQAIAIKKKAAGQAALGELRGKSTVTIHVENLGNVVVHSENK